MGRKVKRCFIWIDGSRLEDLESWFTDMSSKGWELKSISAYFATFEKCIAQNKVYRFEIIEQKDETLADRIELYGQAGWEHVTSRKLLHIFRASENANFIEIHTDPMEQANNIRKLQKKTTAYSASMLALSCFEIGILLWNYFMDKVSFYTDSYRFIYVTFELLCYVLLCCVLIRGLINIQRLINKLVSGKPFDHRSNYKGRLNRWKTAHIAIISLLLAGLVYFIPASIIQEKDLWNFPPIPKGDLPVLCMADVLPDTKLVPNENFDPDNEFHGDLDNNLQTLSSVLLPVQYKLQQSDIVPGINWSDGSGAYNPSIQSEKYHALTPLIARLFFQALLEDNRNDSLNSMEYNITQMQSDIFENIWLFSSKQYGDCIIIAKQKSDVYYLHVYSMIPADTIIKKLEEKVQAG